MTKKIITIVLTTLTIVLFGLALTIMIRGSIAIRNNQLLNILGHSYSVVGSNSMLSEAEDALEKGNIIIIRNVPFEDIEVGDIVVYFSAMSNIHIVHRVIEIQPDGELVTKGDANPSVDPETVNPDNYRGLVTRTITFMNIGSLALDYRGLVFGGIVLILLGVLIYEFIQIFRQIDAKNKAEIAQKHAETEAILTEEAKKRLYEEIKREESTKKSEKD